MKKNLLLIVLLFSGFLSKAQWVNQNVPIPYEGYIYDMEAVDASTAWGVMWNNTAGNPTVYTQDFVRTADGGAIWTMGNISGFNLDNVICNIWPIDSMTAYVCTFNNTAGFGGNILKTIDGGATWFSLDTSMFKTSSSFPDVVYFWNPAQGMALGDPAATPTPKKYEIYLTNDSGATWSRVPATSLPGLTNAAEFGITNLFSASQGYVWFGTTYGSVYRSKNMGVTWTKAASGLPANTINGNRQDIFDIAFTDSLHGMVFQLTSTGSANIRNTSDGGTTWSPVTWVGTIGGNDFDAIPGTNVLINTGTGLGPDTGRTAFSIDNGVTWTTIDSTASHTAVDFSDPITGWTGQYVLGSTGTGGAWKYGLNSPLGAVVRYAKTNETQIYPNPTTGRINVIGGSTPGMTTFEVYDLQGNVMMRESAQTNSTYNHQMELGNLAAGCYVLKIINGNTVTQHKLIKQ